MASISLWLWAHHLPTLSHQPSACMLTVSRLFQFLNLSFVPNIFQASLYGSLWASSCQWVPAGAATLRVFVPAVSCTAPCLCRRPSNTSSRSGPASYEVTALFACVLVCPQSCVCPPRLSFFLPALWNSWDQNLLVFIATFSGGSSSCYQTPRLGCLPWGSGFSLLWQNFCSIIAFHLAGCPPGG